MKKQKRVSQQDRIKREMKRERRVQNVQTTSSPKKVTFELSELQSLELLTHGYLRRETLTAVGRVSGQELRGEEGVNDVEVVGVPGRYEIEWALSHPANIVPASNEFQIGSAHQGDSLLALPKHKILQIQAPLGQATPHLPQPKINFELIPNRQNRLALIKTSLEASSFADAEMQGWQSLAPLLSAWSFAHDVPLEVARINLSQKDTRVMRTTFQRLPYRQVDLHDQFLNDLSLMRWYHPLVYYREGLASLSPQYQFLCFYKAAEVVRRLRSLECDMAKEEEQAVRVIEDKWHEDDWARENIDAVLLGETEGRTFNHLMDNVLREVRHYIAHAFEDQATGQKTLKTKAERIQQIKEEFDKQAEALLSTERVYKYLPLMKAVARRLIIAQFDIKLLE